MAAIVREQLEAIGLDVEVDALGNVVGILDAGPGATVVLDAHMDTVGVTNPKDWAHSPRGEIADDALWGRGAMDMKGQLAAAIHAVAGLRGRLRSGRVVVCASVAEELAEGVGLLPVLETQLPDRVVVCEATGLRVVTGQRGRAELIIEVDGTATHSARPQLGINAVEVMADVIAALRRVELPTHGRLGDAILVITDVISRPYPGLSVVPDLCVATYDRRTLPGERAEEVISQVEQIVNAIAGRHGTAARVTIAIDQFAGYPGALVEAPNFAPAWEIAQDHPVVTAARAALRAAALPDSTGTWAFCTNASASAGTHGIPTIGYGPGDETLAHRVDEHIGLSELHDGARGFAAVAQALAELPIA